MLGKMRTIGSESKSLGIVPIAGKPVHLGHWKLIELAARENERVIVYTSLKDRKRTGEAYVSGKTFTKFWNEFFIPALPNNVKVKFVDSPVRYAIFEMGWLEQVFTQDKTQVPTVRLYSDDHDVEGNFKDEELQKKYPTLTQNNLIQKRGISRSSTVNISGTKMREFLQTGDKVNFIKYLPPVPINQKQQIWDMMNQDIKNRTMKEQITEIINEVVSELKLLKEGGESTAMTDPKTQKTIGGELAKPQSKLDAGQNTSVIVSDIKTLIMTLNDKINFWDKTNPFIHNGYMFNGSSQHLMNPETTEAMVAMKSEYGDIDIIIPREKLESLENYLDSSLDNNEVEWVPTTQNKVTDKWFYVGRPKSFQKIPDQTVTLWYYFPRRQVIQVDFEGDKMQTVTVNGKDYLKPSDWAKFSKSAPMEDQHHKIKGLAHKIMLRALARSVFYLGDVAVVGKTRKPSRSQKHTQPSLYTFNPAGEQGGLRQAYKPSGTIDVDGQPTDAYEFIEAKAAKELEGDKAYIKELPKIFKMLFGADPIIHDEAGYLEQPSGSDLKNFESFVGLVTLIKKAHAEDRISTKTIKRLVVYFSKLMGDQSGIDEEVAKTPVKYLVNQLKPIIQQ
jgi:hypothetical protein